MPQLSIAPGSTSVSLQIRVLDKTKSDGSGLTGLAWDSPSLTAYYNREREASTQITLATLAAANSAWSSGGFKEIDATNKPGEYRLDLPNAAIAAGSRFVVVTIRGASNMADCVLMIDLKNESSVAAIADGVITAAKFAAGALDAVWSTSSRTLSSFGTLVADVATAVWGAASRTLTAFGFTVATNSDSNVAAIMAKTDNLPTDPSDQSAVEAAITAAVADLATTSDLATIEAMLTVLQGAQVVHISSPIGLDGTVSMLTAYDYKNADGLAISFLNQEGSWPNLTGATCKVVDFDTRADLGGTVTVVTPTGANQAVRWDIGKTTFATSAKGSKKYILEATLSNTDKIALTVGNLILR